MPLVSSGAGTRFKVAGLRARTRRSPDCKLPRDRSAILLDARFSLLRGRDFNEADLAANARQFGIIGDDGRHFWPE